MHPANLTNDVTYGSFPMAPMAQVLSPPADVVWKLALPPIVLTSHLATLGTIRQVVQWS